MSFNIFFKTQKKYSYANGNYNILTFEIFFTNICIAIYNIYRHYLAILMLNIYLYKYKIKVVK